jgi:uncharacterized protein (TIGR02246 family)
MRRGPFAGFVLLAAACHPAAAPAAAPADAVAVRAVIESYRAAWLRGDAEGVMRTFTDDAVLMPAHGHPPLVGSAAIRGYWWPPGAPATALTGLAITVDEVVSDGRLAYVRGTDDVRWTAPGGAHHSASTYLNVMRRLDDGSWRTVVRMWNDSISE